MSTIGECRRRRGMLLPLVMVAMLLLLCMSVALQQVAWRSARSARTQWDSYRGLYAADAAIVRAVAEWRGDSMAIIPLGTRLEWDEPDADGWTTRVSLARTGTLAVVAHARAQRDRDRFRRGEGRVGDATRIDRTVTRALSLDPPSLPLLASVTLLGPGTLGSATVDGRDRLFAVDPARDDCGPLRDSASVPALAAATVIMRDAPTLFGATTTIPVGDITAYGARFDNGFAKVVARAQPLALTTLGSLPTVRWWRASVITGGTSVTMEGSSRYVGLLAVDGDLIVRGSLELDGLLVVRGAVDVSAGTLILRGALVARDANVRGSSLGAGVSISYRPCLVGRALVAVATPRSVPFGVWNSP